MKSGKILALTLLVVVVLTVSAMHIAPALAQKISYAQARGESQAARENLPDPQAAQQLSSLFRNVAKAVQPAVVEIRTTKMIERSMNEPFGGDFENIPPGLRGLFGNPQGRTRRYEARGVGSGVIVDAENGYILTNNHVVVDADKLIVVLADDREIEAEWVRRDPDTDLAVVKINTKDLVGAPLGDSDAMEVGDWVLAMGSPMQLSHTVTAGIISAKGRKGSPMGGAVYSDYLQTDAAINRGNSGGPLVNMRGEVIGINTAIVTPSGGFAGIGLSIPSNLAKSVMDQLVSKGRVSRGFLGIVIGQTEKGLMVRTVLDDSAAARGGMQVGDMIVGIDGRDIDDLQEALTAIAAMAPGSEHTFSVQRGDERVKLEIEMGERPDDVASAFELGGGGSSKTLDLSAYGIEVAQMTEQLARTYGFQRPEGVVITGAAPTLGAMGVKPGLRIRRVGDTEITDLNSLRQAIDTYGPGDALAVRLEAPGGSGMSILLEPMKSADEDQ